ncbi:MAG: Glyoxalase family protein [Ktedonobacterales bacterium]|nr:MAG: Glyoxalase family protein [Ktedonobacterales bacterium]
MNSQLGGLHHVTAVTGDAEANVAFYTQTLGLRLVKKTVNQDDVAAYHLFYGDATGHAGTELTFFDWPQAVRNRQGTGTISAILLRAPDRAALTWWAQRFDDLNVAHDAIAGRAGRATLPFTDFEGQHYELIAPADGEPVPVAGGEPWTGSPVPAAYQLRGLHGVRLLVRRLEPTENVLTQTLGFRAAGDYTLPASDDIPAPRDVRIFAVGDGGPGAEVHLEVQSDLPQGVVGIGGVHHVAFRTPNDEEHLAWRKRILAAHIPVTQQIDRFYFHSIYFREPGGVLFEIATEGPGFATDEDPAHLGERLALPPFLEPYREEIEAGLRPLATPPAADAAALSR